MARTGMGKIKEHHKTVLCCVVLCCVSHDLYRMFHSSYWDQYQVKMWCFNGRMFHVKPAGLTQGCTLSADVYVLQCAISCSACIRSAINYYCMFFQCSRFHQPGQFRHWARSSFVDRTYRIHSFTHTVHVCKNVQKPGKSPSSSSRPKQY